MQFINCPYTVKLNPYPVKCIAIEVLSPDGYNLNMEKMKYIYWQDEGMWLGYLEEHPDYMTQGESIEELEAHLKDIYKELTSGNIPCIRKVAELRVS